MRKTASGGETIWYFQEIKAYTVTFNTNGGSAVSAQSVESGSSASQPEAPTRAGYSFEGWYSDSGLTGAFDFTAPVMADAHVEEVINNAHLETLRERYPEIEKGPFFLGLSEIGDKGVQFITIVAICKEDTKYWIQRIINRKIKLLFEENNIQLGEQGDDDDD